MTDVTLPSLNVVVAPEFSLQPRKWCFPVSGCVPYRGYFEKEAAEQFAQKMRSKEYDVSVSQAAAYSTLGWFDDPLLAGMLEQPAPYLAAVIFHELAHQRLYAADDSAFNEAFATAVERIGVERWLHDLGDAGAQERYAADGRARTAFVTFLD